MYQSLDLVVAAEDIDDLVLNKSLDVLSCRLQILSRIEVLRMLIEVLTDRACHCQTEVRVDVDLADSESCSLSELFFRNTDSVRHISAVLVDDLYEFLRNGGSTMENDREARQSLGNFVKNVEAQRRRYEDTLFVSCALFRLELVSTMGCSDSDCKGVAACSCYEFFNVFRSCVGRIFSRDLDIIFNACECAELSFDNNTACVCIFNNLLCDFNVLFERLAGSVNHDTGETVIDAGFAGFECVTMIQMQNNRQTCFDNCCFNELDQICSVGICSCAFGDLQDNRCVAFFCSFGDTLDNFHVVNVESTNGISAFICFLEHFS